MDIKERGEAKATGGGDISDPLGVLAPHLVTAYTWYILREVW